MSNMSNLPPGVSDHDIPGNRPEDVAYEKLLLRVNNEIAEYLFDTYGIRWTQLSQSDYELCEKAVEALTELISLNTPEVG